MFPIHRLRRFAAHVLLLWLLALGISVAHACLPAAPRVVMSGAPAPEAGCHHGDEGAAGGGEACAKFCADEASSVPVHKPPLPPVTGPALALVPTLALLGAVAAPAGVIADAMALQPPPDPLPILLQRLNR